MPDLVDYYEKFLERTCREKVWSRAPNGICGMCDQEAEIPRRCVPYGRQKITCRHCGRRNAIIPKAQMLSRTCMALLRSVNGRKQAELEFLKGLGIVRLSEEKYEWRGV